MDSEQLGPEFRAVLGDGSVQPEIEAMLGVLRFSGVPFMPAEEYLRRTAHYYDATPSRTGRMAREAKVAIQERRKAAAMLASEAAVVATTAERALPVSFDMDDRENPLASLQFALAQLFAR